MNNFVSYNVESPPERDFPFHQFNLSVIFDPGCSWLLLRIHPRSSSSSLNNARSLLDGSYLRQLVLSWPLLSLWHGSSSTPGTLLLVICLFSLQWNKVTRTHSRSAAQYSVNEGNYVLHICSAIVSPSQHDDVAQKKSFVPSLNRSGSQLFA